MNVNKKKILLISIIAIVVIAILFVAMFCVCFPKRKRSLINEISKKYGLQSYMVASVINIESRYKEDALSKAGAMGLMQLLPTTAIECAGKIGLEFKIEDLYVDSINIELGCYYLAYLLDLFDYNITNTLCAYNWGLSNVRLWMDKGNIDAYGNVTNSPVKETRSYLKKFKINKFVYQNIYGY